MFFTTYSEVLDTAPLRRPSIPPPFCSHTDLFLVNLRGKLQLIPRSECVEFFLHSSKHLHGVNMLLNRVLCIIMYYRFLCNNDNYYNYFLRIFRWNCVGDSNNRNLRVWLRHNTVHKVGCCSVSSPHSAVVVLNSTLYCTACWWSVIHSLRCLPDLVDKNPPIILVLQLGPCIFKLWWRKDEQNAFSK
jgi:hypothetical protein